MKTDKNRKTVSMTKSEYAAYCEGISDKKWGEIIQKHYVLNTENYKVVFKNGFSSGIKAGFELIRQIESGEISIEEKS